MDRDLHNWVEERLKRDCDLINRLQPGLRIKKVRPGYPINSEYLSTEESTIAEGLYRVSASPQDRKYWFHLAFCFPKFYPACHPKLVIKDSRYPLCEPDRHIAGRGIACLGSPGIVLSRWMASYDIEIFLSEVIDPWLAWQVCFDAGIEHPPDLAHGSKGIFDAYRDFFGNQTDKAILGFVELLEMEQLNEKKIPCPCGSGKSLRKCHYGVVKKVRSFIPHLSASLDLNILKESFGENT
jgi:hypothetical protein